MIQNKGLVIFLAIIIFILIVAVIVVSVLFAKSRQVIDTSGSTGAIPPNCNGNGTYNTTLNRCICNPGYTGINCSNVIPDISFCVGFASSPYNRYQIFNNDGCSQSGWTRQFTFNAFSTPVANTQKYCIGYIENPNRSILVQTTQDCSSSISSLEIGARYDGEFYAYKTEQPNTDGICVKTNSNTRYEFTKYSDTNKCEPLFNGWYPYYSFYTPK
jgi:hypothetical protein